MKHDEIADHVADALAAEYGYEVRRECHPSPDTQERVDVVAFGWPGRRPEIVVEVKPKITNQVQLDTAVGQVARYVQMFQEETPRARILPVVVAEHITPGLDVDRWRFIARVWPLERFDYMAARRRFHTERDWFLDSAALGIEGERRAAAVINSLSFASEAS